MIAHYHLKTSKQNNAISCCFSKNTKFIYTIYSPEIINLIITKCKYVNLTYVKKNSLNNYQLSIKLHCHSAFKCML